MAAAQLNVQIGAQIKELQKGIREAEKELRRASSSLGGAAKDLSTYITLPLLGVGVAAIKSAGEMEALSKAMAATFQGAGRSVGEANAELQALKKAAEAPGLDFPQAVQASLRLQGVGYSAEKSRGIIVQLANAIATTGGTAENLSGVTRQFAQIISKGKVLTEDLNIIKENMPGLAKVMQDTFGTTTAEGIRALGVDGKEFVDKITVALEKLPRVSGGISNSIVNAGTAVKTFLASVGDSLNKTFDVSGKLDAFSTYLTGLGDKFSGLSDSTKNTVFSVGVFALALGPALKAAQLLVTGIVSARSALLAFKAQSLAIQATGLVEWFKSLSLATKLTGIGAAVAVAGALYLAYNSVGDSIQSVTDAYSSANTKVAESKVKTDALIATIKNENLSYAERKKALDTLQEIAPTYFKNLSLEKGGLEAIGTAQAAYLENLKRMALAQAAQEKLVDVNKRLLDAQAGLGGSANLIEKAYAGVAVGVSYLTGQQLAYTDAVAAYSEENAKGKIPSLEAEKKKIEELISANAGAVTSATEIVKATNGASESSKERTKRLKEEAKTLKEVQAENAEIIEQLLLENQMDEDSKKRQALPQIPTGAQRASKSNIDIGINYALPDVQMTAQTMAQYESIIKGKLASVSIAAQSASEALMSPAEKIGAFWEKSGAAIEQYVSLAKSALSSIDGLVQGNLQRKITALDAETQAQQDALQKQQDFELLQAGNSRTQKDQINAAYEARRASLTRQAEEKKTEYERKAAIARKGIAIAEATVNTAVAVTKVIANPILAGIVAALGAVQIAAIAATKYATGTNSAKGGMALVGEYGPEMVNLPRGSQVVAANKTQAMLRGSMAQNTVVVTGEFRIKGTDLVLTLEQAQARNNRIR